MGKCCQSVLNMWEGGGAALSSENSPQSGAGAVVSHKNSSHS